MTGTVWDPVITGTPLRLHKYVLSENTKFAPWFVVTCGGYYRCDYNYTSHALVWRVGVLKTMNVKESGCLWKAWNNTTQLVNYNKSCTFNRF